jgi:hypothetical protein
MDIVKLAIRNSRLTLSVLAFLVIAGALAYRAVPKEAEPDVAIPIMYVSLIYQGISPEDAERLLLKPVEAQLKSLKGLKEMKSNAYQGGANVIVEFDPSIVSTTLAPMRFLTASVIAGLPSMRAIVSASLKVDRTVARSRTLTTAFGPATTGRLATSSGVSISAGTLTAYLPSSPSIAPAATRLFD